ncbi:helix-turn-helix domain-containing protein [Parablautia intestinalis]|uniref:helix-turn-helix domain-containing protein n=1 Tax=Parablautia intestinalis TaxID=2320100 RepID=UPI00256F4936|nr:helix-turn-helix transcriptional regulator [Parablautia intestinalis]
MRLNVNNYRRILNEKQLSDGEIIKATGLAKRTYEWILDNGPAECETLERIADAVGCTIGEIVRPDYEGFSENMIEWVKDGERATLSLSQRRTISRVKRLAVQYPEQCQILKENIDGSLYAHIPVNWIKIGPLKRVSDEQREISRNNMLALHSKRGVTTDN